MVFGEMRDLVVLYIIVYLLYIIVYLSELERDLADDMAVGSCSQSHEGQNNGGRKCSRFPSTTEPTLPCWTAVHLLSVRLLISALQQS